MGTAPVVATSNIPVAMSIAPVTMGTGLPSSSVVVAQQQADHLQKVIEAQRTQLALLSQITQSLQHRLPNPQDPLAQRPAGVTGGSRPHSISPSLPPRGGPVSGRLQTFDYGNRSSTELQSLAAQHLEHEYSVRGRWP